MVMVGQSKRLSQPLGWGRREKVALGGLAACLVVAALVVGVLAVRSPQRGGVKQGCITVRFASTLGGAQVYACGARARHICAVGLGSDAALVRALRQQCDLAGYRRA